jgi:hypothetical protein
MAVPLHRMAKTREMFGAYTRVAARAIELHIQSTHERFSYG